MDKRQKYVKSGFSMSTSIEVSMVFVRNDKTLWNWNDTRFISNTVLPSRHNITRIKVLLMNTKPGTVCTTNAESINMYSAIDSLSVFSNYP